MLELTGQVLSATPVQTLGIAASRVGGDGMVIDLGDGQRVGVAEACSGLRMMMLFFAVCVGAALLSRRSAWERIIMALSAVPIAVIANVLRITVTAVLYKVGSAEMAERVFHDLAGYFMMPVAVLMLWLEMWLIGLIVSEPVEEGPIRLRAKPAASRH